MLHPSYTDLMNIVNKDVEEGHENVVNSRYSIVMATAKRARELIDGDEPLVPIKTGEKPLSIAVDELNQEKIHIISAEQAVEELLEAEEETTAVENSEEAEEAEETITITEE